MDHPDLNESTVAALREIVGGGNVLQPPDISEDYTHDEFPPGDIAAFPAAVVKPGTTEEVSEILRLAHRERVPVTPRGGGTGLCGGCVPVCGGILLSLENMDRIIETDTDNMTITCQAGVRLAALYEESERARLFFPPHPGDESAMVGGLVSTNAGGARAVKYGVVRDFLRELEVVLPGGDVIDLGGKMSKNSSGYSLMHLVTGSEGTLGVITAVTLALMARPAVDETLVAPFESAKEAVRAVTKIMTSGVIPMALELLEERSIRLLERKLDVRWPCREGVFYLMVILDGSSRSEIDGAMGTIAEICAEHGSRDILIADSPGKRREVLHMRSSLYEAIKPFTVETLDIALPRSELAPHVEKIVALSGELGIWIPTYGHAADGNLHAHITSARWEDDGPVVLQESEWKPRYEKARDAIHEDAQLRGGVVSGEHGIGLVKKSYLASFLGDRQIELMRGIKKAFDPNGIMNPGKIFDA
jgi:glycolate oxidase